MKRALGLLAFEIVFGAVIAGLITDWHWPIVWIGAITGFVGGLIAIAVGWSLKVR